MAELLTYFDDDSSLVDVATAILTGGIRKDLCNPVTAAALSGKNIFSPMLTLNTNIIPTNGNVSGRQLLSKDDDDVDVFVPTNGKAVKGNLFVGYREMSEVFLGTTASSEVSSFLNDIRQICDDAELFLASQLEIQSATLEFSDAIHAVVIGFLKETQTDDYNPLSVINAGWNYKMFDRETVLQLLESRS